MRLRMPITRARCDRSSTPSTEVERGGQRRRGRLGHGGPRPPGRASEEACRECPPVVVRARVVRAHRLEQVDELLAGGVVVAHPLEQLVQLGLDATTRSTPASSRRASAARARPVSVSGRRCRAASAPAASPRSSRTRASASVAPAWSGSSSRAWRSEASSPFSTSRSASLGAGASPCTNAVT